MPDRTPPEDASLLKVQRLVDMRCAVLRIRSANNEEIRRAGAVPGSPLPLTPNRASGGILWLAPGEWLLTGGLASEQSLAKLQAALEGATFHIADVTHGRSVFEISGSLAWQLLARGCSLDLHPRVFRTGHCAQSLLAQVPSLIHLVSDDLFHLYIDSSHDAFFLAWLERVSRVFQPIEMP
jgi:sarcosine oxidase, subunit gamma